MGRRHQPELMCSIYGLRAVDAAEYFYVGSTKYTPEERLKQHLEPSILKRNKNKHFVRKVAKVGPANIVVDTLDSVSENDRFPAEYRWVRKLLGEGARLTNIVVDAETYISQHQRCDYIERIIHPDYLLAGLEMALEKGRTPDPRNQNLHDRFCEAAIAMFEHAYQRDPEFVEAVLAGQLVGALDDC